MNEPQVVMLLWKNFLVPSQVAISCHGIWGNVQVYLRRLVLVQVVHYFISGSIQLMGSHSGLALKHKVCLPSSSMSELLCVSGHSPHH